MSKREEEGVSGQDDPLQGRGVGVQFLKVPFLEICQGFGECTIQRCENHNREVVWMKCITEARQSHGTGA